MTDLEKKAEAQRAAAAVKKMEESKRQLAIAYGRGLDDGCKLATRVMQEGQKVGV